MFAGSAIFRARHYGRGRAPPGRRASGRDATAYAFDYARDFGGRRKQERRLDRYCPESSGMSKFSAADLITIRASPGPATGSARIGQHEIVGWQY